MSVITIIRFWYRYFTWLITSAPNSVFFQTNRVIIFFLVIVWIFLNNANFRCRFLRWFLFKSSNIWYLLNYLRFIWWNVTVLWGDVVTVSITVLRKILENNIIIVFMNLYKYFKVTFTEQILNFIDRKGVTSDLWKQANTDQIRYCNTWVYIFMSSSV